MSSLPSPLSKAPAPLPGTASVSQISLTVRDLDRVGRFYRHVVGLDQVSGGPGSLWLGARDQPFLQLVENPTGEHHPATTGLFHLAILYPSRSDLAAVTARLIALQAPLQGASDHGVSEAVYFADPEGNGVEVYRDRPLPEWPRRDSRVEMQTLPLDLGELLGHTPEGRAWRIPPETRLGHVHLRVANIPGAERFYRDVIGLDLMQRYGDSASFLSAGGYHHHVAVNTWGTLGAVAPAEGALGLRWFRIDLGDDTERERVIDRFRSHGAELQPGLDVVRTWDPSGNELHI